MRDLTKSIMNYGWAMGAFGLQQMLNLMTPRQGENAFGRASKAFDGVTKVTVESLDGALKSTYQAGVNLQNAMIDLMFGGMMGTGFDPDRWMQMGNRMFHQMGDPRGAQTPSGSAACASGSASPCAGTAENPLRPPESSWGPMPGSD